MPTRNRTWIAHHTDEKYYKLAKREGYRARSAFKLLQIMKKHTIFEVNGRSPDTILDLGCSPGSWVEVILKTYEENRESIKRPPRILGMDLTTPRPFETTMFEFFRCDIMKEQCEEKVKTWSPTGYDLILSDLAPKTSGNDSSIAIQEGMVERVLELASKYLKSHGNIVIKVFQSEFTQDILKKYQAKFDTLRLSKPNASTPSSRETFLVGLDFIQ